MPHFVQNVVSHTKLPVYFRNLPLLGAWDLVTIFRIIGPKMVYLTLLWSPTFNFHKQPLILIEMFFSHTKLLIYFRNLALLGGLEPSDHFWDNWENFRKTVVAIIVNPDFTNLQNWAIGKEDWRSRIAWVTAHKWLGKINFITVRTNGIRWVRRGIKIEGWEI